MPQGAEKQLIKAILDREVPPGRLPMDVGVVVINIGQPQLSLMRYIANALISA